MKQKRSKYLYAMAVLLLGTAVTVGSTMFTTETQASGPLSLPDCFAVAECTEENSLRRCKYFAGEDMAVCTQACQPADGGLYWGNPFGCRWDN